MQMPKALSSLDDRVLGDRFRRTGPQGARTAHAEVPAAADRDRPKPRGKERVTERVEERGKPAAAPPSPSGEGLRQFLATVLRISRLVFLLLAAVCVLGIVFVLAPTNADNDVVRLVSDTSERVAGPFKDVFSLKDPDRSTMVNYAFAAVVYVVAATLMSRLPLPGKKKG